MTLQEKKLIDKYIERIKIDYPEDDKLMIDLQQFKSELAALESQEEVKPTNVTETDKSVRNILIDYACRNDKYQTTNIQNANVTTFLRMLREDHARLVDDWMNNKIPTSKTESNAFAQEAARNASHT